MVEKLAGLAERCEGLSIRNKQEKTKSTCKVAANWLLGARRRR
jgi:hypothetical protein